MLASEFFFAEYLTALVIIFCNTCGKEPDYETNPYPVIIEEKEVDSKTILSVDLARSGGVALIFSQL